MISKEVFEILTEEVITLFERTRAEHLGYEEFHKEIEEIRNKHNISEGEMAHYLEFLNARLKGDLDA